jgi:glycosyltransferase involved in cell wall biosynthesis
MNEFHPLVSIVIPVYNGSNYMQCAIDSALGQDYDNIEVIVVNDGSTDNTDEIAKSYGDKIRYFSKKNGGVSTALNLAIENAKGEYISWLSHDDYYLPNKVSRQIEKLGKLESREKILICSGCKFLDMINNIEINNIISDCKNVVFDKISSLKLMYIEQAHFCSFLVPIEAFYQVGFFDPELRATQDYFLWFKFIDAGYLFFYIPEILIVTRMHKEQVSFSKLKMCFNEELRKWDFANKLFHDDIKQASKKEKKIFIERKNKPLNHIKKIIYVNSPFFVKKIWRTLKFRLFSVYTFNYKSSRFR